MAAGTETITALVLCSLSSIFALCLIYYEYKFYKLRHETVTIKRRGSLVVTYTLCAIIILLFGYPLNFLHHWHVLPKSIILNIMEDIFFNPFYFFYLFFVLARYWLMYYDIQFSHSCSNFEWKQLIDPNSDVLSTDKWFISCHSTLGNQSYILKRAVIIASIVSLLSLTTVFLFEFGVISIALWYFVIGIVGALMLVAMLYLTIKMPRFEDSIHLYKEARIISISFISFYCMYLLSALIQMILKQNLILAIVIRFAGMMAAFIVPFISTFWVLQQLETPDLSRYSSAQLSAQDWLLTDIFEKEGFLELFIQHLTESFCVENIIGLIECIQFKEHLIETFDIKKNEAGRDFDDIVFPESVPESCIVYGSLDHMDDEQDEDDFREQKLNQCKKAAYQLYTKYFELGAEYEVNLCLMTRKEISEWMDDRFMDGYETWVDSNDASEELLSLVKVFDDAIMEMVSWLRRSKQNFELTQDQLRPIVKLTC